MDLGRIKRSKKLKMKCDKQLKTKRYRSAELPTTQFQYIHTKTKANNIPIVAKVNNNPIQASFR